MAKGSKDRRISADIEAQVEFPGAAIWHELSIAFPEAREIHSERAEDARWASYSNTIKKFWILGTCIYMPPPVAEIFETMDKILVSWCKPFSAPRFRGRFPKVQRLTRVLVPMGGDPTTA